MPVTNKLTKVVRYGKGLPPIKSNDPLGMLFREAAR